METNDLNRSRKGAQSAKRGVKNVDHEIAVQLEKLKQLQALKKNQVRMQRERNGKAILQVLQQEKLDQVPVEKWESVLPQIKALLGGT